MIEVETPQPHIESYALYVLDRDGKNSFIPYGYYEVNSEDVYFREINGNIITIYQTTGDTRIIFASNGITVISPQGHQESFTQGYIKRE